MLQQSFQKKLNKDSHLLFWLALASWMISSPPQRDSLCPNSLLSISAPMPLIAPPPHPPYLSQPIPLHLPVFFPSSISDKTIEVVEVFGYTQKQSEEWDILKPPLSRPQGRCNSPGVNNVKKQHIFFVSGVRLGSKRASAFCLKLIIWPEPQALGPLCKLLSF